MANRHLDTVRTKLKGYAQRGHLLEFEEKQARGGKTEFRFIWLHDKPFALVIDEKTATLTFKNALPNMPVDSAPYKDVRTFVQSRSERSLPAHRRVDTKRAELTCFNRGSAVSLRLTVKRNQYAYGLTKLLNVTKELFAYLDLNHIQYLWEQFDVPEE